MYQAPTLPCCIWTVEPSQATHLGWTMKPHVDRNSENGPEVSGRVKNTVACVIDMRAGALAEPGSAANDSNHLDRSE